MKSTEIKGKQNITAFRELVEIFNLEAEYISNSEHLIVVNVKRFKVNKNQLRACSDAQMNPLYSLYATHRMIISDLKWSTMAEWQDNHPGMTLDHILPRKFYPRKTFNCANWQALSEKDNKAKNCSADIDLVYDEARKRILNTANW